jgi:hypothetical protein
VGHVPHTGEKRNTKFWVLKLKEENSFAGRKLEGNIKMQLNEKCIYWILLS